MHLPENHESFYFKVKMSFLTPSNSGYHEPKKPVEKSLNAYKLMKEESLLVRHSKASATREISILAM